MIYKSLLLIIFIVSGCSFKTPQNQWQYQSTNAFNSYTKNFLSANDILAHNDLKRSIKHAKQSANLHQLATIYLATSALNLSVGNNPSFTQYKKIADVVEDKSLQAYYYFLNGTLLVQEISLLPKNYQTFASLLQKKKYIQAQEEIKNMQKITSQLISGALMKEKLTNQTKEYLLQQASFYGYKKAVLFWLHQLILSTKDTKKAQLLQKKILILQEGML